MITITLNLDQANVVVSALRHDAKLAQFAVNSVHATGPERSAAKTRIAVIDNILDRMGAPRVDETHHDTEHDPALD